MKTYKQIKRVLKIGEKEVAEAFGLSVSSLANSTAKERYRKGIERMYQMFESAERTPYPKEEDYGEKYSPYLHRDDLINWIENNKH